ncbi:hypothetical protein KIN20_021485 [Parelaphostrongylus tenuis]|uniref:Uncharacterized protein n=1 Tax=Parelaphostrongylus tenuis TaxID=148309 RepID=A0AAD5MU65_PARTN|nr:hypothetical protein KIN20_021485 [Parelaphostrongylus tenuis]
MLTTLLAIQEDVFIIASLLAVVKLVETTRTKTIQTMQNYSEDLPLEFGEPRADCLSLLLTSRQVPTRKIFPQPTGCGKVHKSSSNPKVSILMLGISRVHRQHGRFRVA